MATNRAEWRFGLLSRLDAVTHGAYRAFGAWEKAESGPPRPDGGMGRCDGIDGARWNILNTTMDWPGATIYHENPHGVKNYKEYIDGIDATIKTLKLPAYVGILAAIRKENVSVQEVLEAIGATPWGTSLAGLEAAWNGYKSDDSKRYYNGLPIGPA